jgi:hypothetical protein
MTRSLAVSLTALMFVALVTTGVQAQKARTTSGVVKALTDASITVEATTADKASHTFSLDAQTRVIARGATKATQGTGQGSITTLIGVGDSVTVAFDPTKPDHATEVRLVKKTK